jgi:hypothetical protein
LRVDADRDVGIAGATRERHAPARFRQTIQHEIELFILAEHPAVEDEILLNGDLLRKPRRPRARIRNRGAHRNARRRSRFGQREPIDVVEGVASRAFASRTVVARVLRMEEKAVAAPEETVLIHIFHEDRDLDDAGRQRVAGIEALEHEAESLNRCAIRHSGTQERRCGHTHRSGRPDAQLPLLLGQETRAQHSAFQGSRNPLHTACGTAPALAACRVQ